MNATPSKLCQQRHTYTPKTSNAELSFFNVFFSKDQPNAGVGVKGERPSYSTPRPVTTVPSSLGNPLPFSFRVGENPNQVKIKPPNRDTHRSIRRLK